MYKISTMTIYLCRDWQLFIIIKNVASKRKYNCVICIDDAIYPHQVPKTWFRGATKITPLQASLALSTDQINKIQKLLEI